MKRVTACIAIAAMIVGCNEGIAPPPADDAAAAAAAAKGISMSTPPPVTYHHDTIQLSPEGGAGGAALMAGPAAVEAGDGVHYNLIKVAHIAEVTVGSNKVQANDILISGTTAYIAYNYQGGPWIGAIVAFDISSPETPVPLYQINFENSDINALGLDGGKLLLTGASDPLHPDWDGILSFAATTDAATGDVGQIASSIVGLPSYTGTGIRAVGNSYYVSVGAGEGSIQVLDRSTMQPVDALPYADVRDMDVWGGGVIALAGTTDNDAATGRVIMPGGSPSEVSIVDFVGSDYHKATVEVFGEVALLGLSDAGFKVLDLGSNSFIHESGNPTPLVEGLQTNTNSASTNGNVIVTANGEYGFRILRPNQGDFSDIDVVGYFASELPPQGNLESRFSVNHVAMSGDCFFAAAGNWGVYVYCLEQALPEISVTKTANLEYIGWSSGGLGDFVADRTFTEDGEGLPDDELFFGAPTCDDAGPNDEPNQVDFNCMARADNIPGTLGLWWSWDDTNSWSGKGQTGDGCALLDTNEDGDAEVAVCARIENDPETGEIIQIGGDGAVDVYTCGNSREDRCSQPVDPVPDADKGFSNCSIALGDEAFPGEGDDGADVEATCEIDLGMAAFAGAGDVQLLNVCAFPSGEPNSNPFDCVVTPGSGFVRILKLVDPEIEDLFGFTLSPGATDETSRYAVASGVTSALIPVAPGSYSLTETLPSGWFLDTAACAVNQTTTGSLDGLVVSGIEVSRGQTVLCTFENEASTSADVTFTVTVTNLGGGLEPVTLDSLVDDVFGDLNGVGDCAIGGTIGIDESYSCTFTEMLSGAPGVDTHMNTVTAVASDDDGSDEETATLEIPFMVEPQN